MGKKSLGTVAGTLLLSGALFFGSGQTASAEEQGTQSEREHWEWIARSPEEIEIMDPSNYEIQRGDTLWAISLASGVSIDALVDRNNIANRDLIYAGDTLVIEGERTSEQEGSSNTNEEVRDDSSTAETREQGERTGEEVVQEETDSSPPDANQDGEVSHSTEETIELEEGQRESEQAAESDTQEDSEQASSEPTEPAETEEPAEESNQSGAPPTPSTPPEEATEPEEPAEPETPGEPGDEPGESDEPTEQEPPEEPGEEPSNPDSPSEPGASDEQVEEPAVPGQPEDSETPEEPENEPTEPDVPEEEPAEPEDPAEDEEPSTTDAERMLELVNDARTEQGLRELSYDSELNEFAMFRANDMAENDYFSHDSPVHGTFQEMVESSGLLTRGPVGENILSGTGDVEVAFEQWMNSPGHRANILNGEFNYFGLAYESNGNYWVQIFSGN